MPEELTDRPDALGFAEILRGTWTTALLALDRDGHVCGLNSDAEKLLNLNRGEPSASELPLSLRELFHETINSAQCVSDRSLTISDGPGSQPVRVSSMPCFEGEQLAGVVLVLCRLEGSNEVHSSMQRLDRLASIGTLSASMAHEIKNAFVAVQTFVDDLLERNKESDLASLVKRELRRIDSIVSQILKFSGPARPVFAPVSVHRILDQCLRLMQPQLRSKQLRLRRNLSAARDLIEGDEYQLEQAFINVLLNASAAMNPNGELTVTTEGAASGPPSGAGQSDDPHPYLVVHIADTGHGISADHLGRLFEPFFTTKAQGTGLGLPITQQIINSHRGQILVDSAIGQGTTFHIWLPVAPQSN